MKPKTATITIIIAAVLFAAACGGSGERAVETARQPHPNEQAASTTSPPTTTIPVPETQAPECQPTAEDIFAMRAVEYELDVSSVTVDSWELPVQGVQPGIRLCQAQIQDYGAALFSSVFCVSDEGFYWMGVEETRSILDQVEDCQILLQGMAVSDMSSMASPAVPGHAPWVLDEAEGIVNYMETQGDVCERSSSPSTCVRLTLDEACRQSRDLQMRATGTASQDLADKAAEAICAMAREYTQSA